MTGNAPALEILIEEKDMEVFNPDQSSTNEISPEKESLLPPLPSSSSSLPIETSNSTSEEIPKGLNQSNNMPSYQVSTASLESMLHHVDINNSESKASSNSVLSTGQSLIVTQPLTDPLSLERQHYSQSVAREVYERSNSSSNLPSQGSETNDSTRQGSVSSLNSTVSASSSRAIQKIKSGLRKLSSPLTLTPKMEPKEEVEDVDSPMELTEKNSIPPVFKRPFLPRRTSNLSNASISSSASSINPLTQTKHSHTNSSASNRTGENTSNLFTSPISSPVIAVNEKFGSRASSDGSEFHFPQQHHHVGNETGNLFDKFNLNQFDTIDEKVTYIETLKRQMENEDAAYKITERRLLNSGWATDNEIAELKKRRDAAIRQWKDGIDRLEGILYRSNGS